MNNLLEDLINLKLETKQQLIDLYNDHEQVIIKILSQNHYLDPEDIFTINDLKIYRTNEAILYINTNQIS